MASGRVPFGAVRCGENWRFGRGGEGDAAWLRGRGVSVDVVPYAVYGGERISSSRIRGCLGRGELEAANAMMGRALCVAVRRFRGKGLGAGLGFPTVNFESDAPVLRLLPRGAYAVEAAGLCGVANYGVAPTMGEKAWGEPVLEVHFPDGAPPDDAPLEKVSFLRFMRAERRFAGVDDLRRQIADDVNAVRAYWRSSRP